MVFALGKLVISHRHGVQTARGLIERSRLFTKFDWGLLLASAERESKLNTALKVGTKVVFDRVEDVKCRNVFSHHEEADDAMANIRRCIAKVHRGEVSRGMAALSPSPIANATPEVIEELRKKHPEANGTGISEAQRKLLLDAPLPEVVSEREVLGCLRKFPPGSSAGPSGLTPSVLLSLASHPGSALAPVLASTVHAVMCGVVPAEIREFLFGARLVPLIKKDKALRPIAAGETLRRVAAKILATRSARKFRDILTKAGQIGVAVSSGLEALASWTRQSAKVIGEDEVIAKVDFANAFNSFHRAQMAKAVLEYVPEIARYVEAAYGEPTYLMCGDQVIRSEVGAQQGDPLGPVLFSLAALHCTRLPENLHTALRGCGWYLDDGLIAGPAQAVYEALRFIQVRGAEIGLVMNVDKTEILSENPSVWEPFKEDFCCWRPLSDLELLGLPCSPHPEGLENYVSVFKQRLVKRTHVIAQVAKEDAHVGYLLLRMCTGFAASVHLARAMGPLPVFAEIDACTNSALDAIVPLDARALKLASLPFRLGGLGIRRIVDHAVAAFMAAAIETFPLMELFTGSKSARYALPDDELFGKVWPQVPQCIQKMVEGKALLVMQHSSLPRAPDMSVVIAHTSAPLAPPPPSNTVAKKDDDTKKDNAKLQHHFSVAIDDHAFAKLNLSGDEMARATSCGSRGASLYLVGPLSYDERLSEFFMESRVFETALRLRLGLFVRAETARWCPACGEGHGVSLTGDEALTCMFGGNRTRAHNALRDTLSNIVRDALLAPRMESSVYNARDKKLRADFVFWLGGLLHVVDTAITHVFVKDPQHAIAAAAHPGGAATRYEKTKQEKYGQLPKNLLLVPFVVDSFGALGQSGHEVLSRVISYYARRLGITHAVASRVVYGRITTVVIKWMATIACQA